MSIDIDDRLIFGCHVILERSETIRLSISTIFQIDRNVGRIKFVKFD